MRYVTQGHHLTKNTLGTLPPDTTALLRPEESASKQPVLLVVKFDSSVSETARYSLWGCSVMSSALTGEILMLLDGPMLTTREGTTRWWWWSVARVVAGLGLLARRQPPPPPPPPPHGSGRPQHQPPPDRSTTAMADDSVYRRAGKQRGQNESSKSHVPAPHSHSHCHLELRPQATSQRHTDRNTTALV